MRVFISWSGERSRRVALLLRGWLKCVIQASDPWVSSEDIESGSIWFTEIGDQLSSTTVGIVCLTQENKDKPWILFETGALMKGLSKSRVCPFLIDLENQDVKPPLSQFNLSSCGQEGVFKIVKAVNNSLSENALPIDVFTSAFNTYWPQFEEQFIRIIQETNTDQVVPGRNEEDVLTEILLTVRGLERRVAGVEKLSVDTGNSTRYGKGQQVYICTISLDTTLGSHDVDALVTQLTHVRPELNVVHTSTNVSNNLQLVVLGIVGYCPPELIAGNLQKLNYPVIRVKM